MLVEKLRKLFAVAEPVTSAQPNVYTRFPPGHYYSPVPDIAQLMTQEKNVFPENYPSTLPGIDMNVEGQFALLEAFKAYREEYPFTQDRREGMRYVFSNTMYCGTEGALLHYMIRHLKPRRLIEIGSGYSSCFTLDTNELFFNNSIKCTFIEPHPERFNSLIKKSDKARIDIRPYDLQTIDINLFGELGENDILFVDSTHVSKTNSDVNYLIHEIFPRLSTGVYIHIHDIFYPFEYPKQWVYDGLFWNEAYMLRAFLEFNNTFRIIFFHDYMLKFHRDAMLAEFPYFSWGQNIWIVKCA